MHEDKDMRLRALRYNFRLQLNIHERVKLC